MRKILNLVIATENNNNLNSLRKVADLQFVQEKGYMFKNLANYVLYTKWWGISLVPRLIFVWGWEKGLVDLQ